MQNFSASMTLPPFKDFVGYWDLDHPSKIVSPEDAFAFTFPLAWSIEALEGFFEAFPWCIPQTAEVAVIGLEAPVHWNRQQGELDTWLVQLLQYGQRCGGTIITFDTSIYWSSAGRAPERTIIPEGADLLHSVNGQLFSEGLTVWPNVFANTVRAYTNRTPRNVQFERITITETARLNRALLRNSLQLWEQISGGIIINWESETIETGVESYGFAEDATSI